MAFSEKTLDWEHGTNRLGGSRKEFHATIWGHAALPYPWAFERELKGRARCPQRAGEKGMNFHVAAWDRPPLYLTNVLR